MCFSIFFPFSPLPPFVVVLIPTLQHQSCPLVLICVPVCAPSKRVLLYVGCGAESAFQGGKLNREATPGWKFITFSRNKQEFGGTQLADDASKD